MSMLRKGAAGAEVRKLQEILCHYGAKLRPDGKYGVRTEFAVRTFQRKTGLLPDGIAGPKTFRLLTAASSTSIMKGVSTASLDDSLKAIGGTVAHASTNAKLAPVPLTPSRPSFSHAMSLSGLQFIFNHEALRGVSNRLHWPGGASGVTLGPGYDMKERTSIAIAEDMKAIGVPESVALKISGAAGLSGNAAKAFAEDCRSLVNLTPQQETQLLKQVVPRYEAIIRRLLRIDLLQHEFDALVSFAYNPGGRLASVARLLNEGHVAEAMKTIKLAVTSRGIVMKGLVSRRDHEVSLFLYGSYRGAV